ncbi:MAG TPA: glycosyltransferase family 2 protein [Pseudomonadales bacterium]|nr:glycosyltransferase family 2 protein [Pseudomonadales bacterium]
MGLRADIIVPVRNEQENLPQLLARLRALPDFSFWHLVFVDNASTDNSAAFIESIPGITLIRHPYNMGYGASLRSGIAAAQTDRIVIIDADCEYPPECIPLLLSELEEHAIVYASRLIGKNSARQAGMLPIKWWGNRVISSAYNVLFSQHVTDLYTGCKALQRQCLKNIVLQRDGFEQVLELAAKLSARGYAIAEIAVDFVPRSHGESKMSHISETIKYFFWLLLYRVQLMPVFLASMDEVPRDR